MSIIITIIIGFVVGLIAKMLMRGDNPMGFIWTTLIGIGGAFIGKFIGRALGIYGNEDAAGFFMSLFGAMILLFIYHHIIKRTTPTSL